MLCDEPFSAMDVEVATKCRKAFRRRVKAQNLIAVAVLHDLEDIVEVCDRVLVIPNKPFTTLEFDDRRYTARIFDNGRAGARENQLNTHSFVEIAESILQGK